MKKRLNNLFFRTHFAAEPGVVMKRLRQCTCNNERAHDYIKLLREILTKKFFYDIIYIVRSEGSFIMQFTHSGVFNFEGAFRGLRNPMNSWDRSDSEFYENDWDTLIGYKDLELAQKLILAGPEHAKFLRQIFVSVDITAPRFWWIEMDTYKISTTANSTSTMHKLTSKPITADDFAFTPNDELIITSGSAPHGGEWEICYTDYIDDIVSMCENLRQKYIDTFDERYWRALIEILPQSYLQTRTWTANYAVLRNIYFQRRFHRLNEWQEFCDWIETLPYAKELITLEE